MELNDVQKQAIAEWVGRGDGISEVQKKLESEFGIKMTYMDVRFMLLDLEVALKDKPEPKKAVEPAADGAAAGGAAGANADLGQAEGGLGGGVQISLDKVVQPGAVVSGSVTFSDGVSATWMLDQMGRLALNAATPGYRPSETDLQEFQLALRDALQKGGF